MKHGSLLFKLAGFLLLTITIFLVYLIFVPALGCSRVDSNQLTELECSGFLNLDPESIGDQPSPEYPDYLAPMEFPHSETRVIRITDNTEQASIGVHQYSRRQAWNQNSSRILLSGSILNASDYSVFKDELLVSSSLNWSNVHPEVVFGIRYNPNRNQLVTWNVETDEISQLLQFDEFEYCSFGEGEGNVSVTDKFLVVVCRTSDEASKVLLTVDLQTRTIIGRMTADEELNWASVTPKGDYILVENNTGAADRRFLFRYSMDFKQETLLTRHVEHGDFALMPNGDQLYVMLTQRVVKLVDIATGEIQTVPLTPTMKRVGFGHVSCLSSAVDSRCLLSTNGSKSIATLYIGDLHNNYLTRGFEYWGSHFSTSSNYESAPKASVSRDGKRVIYSSDWGGTNPVNEYVMYRSATAP